MYGTDSVVIKFNDYNIKFNDRTEAELIAPEVDVLKKKNFL